MVGYVFSLATLIVCACFDIRKRKLPAFVMAVAGAVGVVLILIRGIEWADFLGLIPGGFIIAASLVSRGAVGFGDGLCVLVIGPVLGVWETVAAVFYGLVLTVIVGGIWAIARKKGRKAKIAFTPFLTAGVALVAAASAISTMQV